MNHIWRRLSNPWGDRPSPGTGTSSMKRPAPPMKRPARPPGSTQQRPVGAWAAPKKRLAAVRRPNDILPGGLGDDMPDSAFDPDQLRRGIKVELEHTGDRALAKEIAKDHLTEIPNYYDYLERMEKAAERS